MAAGSPARAEGPVDDEADPVFVFNKVCYSQVPSIGAIRDMATRLAWQALEKTDLKPFSPDPDPEVLEGWDVQVGKKFFRLGLQIFNPAQINEKASGTETAVFDQTGWRRKLVQ